MNATQLAAIKGEITGPHAATYTGMTDEQIAASIRSQAGTIPQTTLAAGVLLASVVLSEWTAIWTGLSAANQVLLLAYLYAPTLPFTANVKACVSAAFNGRPLTLANYNALQNQATTLDVQLGVSGLTASDVADAKRS